MAEFLKVTFGGDRFAEIGLVHLPRLARDMDENIDRGLAKGAAVYEREMKLKVSTGGSSGLHVRTGRLRASINTAFFPSQNLAKIGPNVVYATIHEFGGQAGRGGAVTIPARPYVRPTLDEKTGEVLEIMDREVMSSW